MSYPWLPIIKHELFADEFQKPWKYSAMKFNTKIEHMTSNKIFISQRMVIYFAVKFNMIEVLKITWLTSNTTRLQIAYIYIWGNIYAYIFYVYIYISVDFFMLEWNNTSRMLIFMGKYVYINIYIYINIVLIYILHIYIYIVCSHVYIFELFFLCWNGIIHSIYSQA